MPEPLHHKARKRFGQNFLHDQNIIRRIIDSIHVRPHDHVLEIGPGRGALTRHLAELTDHLDLVELDRDLAAWLATEFAGKPGVKIHQADILKFDLAALADTLANTPADTHHNPLRIVGNLPYNISTPVIFHLLKYQSLISDMTFMLQLEVVNRLAAAPGNKNYGRLGLMVQYYCQVEHLFDVPPGAFSPQPKVISAIVRLTPHTRLPVQARDVDCLHHVIRTAFSQRRKTLKNSLRGLMTEEIWKELDIDYSQRPENLALADYVKISDLVHSRALWHHPNSAD